MSCPVTVDDVLAFRDAVNRGREEFNLPPIEKFEFDQSHPGSAVNCLSARHLVRPAAASVNRYASVIPTGIETTGPGSLSLAQRFATALGRADVCMLADALYEVKLPKAILTVTDEFDACAVDTDGSGAERLDALRAVFVEAGVLD